MRHYSNIFVMMRQFCKATEVKRKGERAVPCLTLAVQLCFPASSSVSEAHQQRTKNTLIKSSGQEDTDMCCRGVVAVT